MSVHGAKITENVSMAHRGCSTATSSKKVLFKNKNVASELMRE